MLCGSLDVQKALYSIISSSDQCFGFWVLKTQIIEKMRKKTPFVELKNFKTFELNIFQLTFGH